MSTSLHFPSFLPERALSLLGSSEAHLGSPKCPHTGEDFLPLSLSGERGEDENGGVESRSPHHHHPPKGWITSPLTTHPLPACLATEPLSRWKEEREGAAETYHWQGAFLMGEGGSYCHLRI